MHGNHVLTSWHFTFRSLFYFCYFTIWKITFWPLFYFVMLEIRIFVRTDEVGLWLPSRQKRKKWSWRTVNQNVSLWEKKTRLHVAEVCDKNQGSVKSVTFKKWDEQDEMVTEFDGFAESLDKTIWKYWCTETSWGSSMSFKKPFIARSNMSKQLKFCFFFSAITNSTVESAEDFEKNTFSDTKNGCY